jgi:hypothetical protein
MRRPYVRHLSLLVTLAAAVACGGRDRVNAQCEWRGDDVFALDLNLRDHRRHLRRDADLLEDLAIRYADAHAGRVARPEWAQSRDRCTARLFPIVAAHHHVSEFDIKRWIGRRNTLFDGAVFLSFVVWCSVVSTMLTRRLFNAWAYRGTAAIVASIIVTLVMSAICGAAGALWSGLLEVVRIGNEHMSHRAWRTPWPYYVPSLFATAAAVCAISAWRQYRAIARRPDSLASPPDRILFG